MGGWRGCECALRSASVACERGRLEERWFLVIGVSDDDAHPSWRGRRACHLMSPTSLPRCRVHRRVSLRVHETSGDAYLWAPGCRHPGLGPCVAWTSRHGAQGSGLSAGGPRAREAWPSCSMAATTWWTTTPRPRSSSSSRPSPGSSPRRSGAGSEDARDHVPSADLRRRPMEPAHEMESAHSVRAGHGAGAR